jgi:hypothetical protein
MFHYPLPVAQVTSAVDVSVMFIGSLVALYLAVLFLREVWRYGHTLGLSLFTDRRSFVKWTGLAVPAALWLVTAFVIGEHLVGPRFRPPQVEDSVDLVAVTLDRLMSWVGAVAGVLLLALAAVSAFVAAGHALAYRLDWADRVARRIGALRLRVRERSFTSQLRWFTGRPPVITRSDRTGEMLTSWTVASVDMCRPAVDVLSRYPEVRNVKLTNGSDSGGTLTVCWNPAVLRWHGPVVTF